MEVFLVPGIEETSVYVPIMEDNMSEKDEVFIIVLRLLEVHPHQKRNEVHLDRNITVARILSQRTYRLHSECMVLIRLMPCMPNIT